METKSCSIESLKRLLEHQLNGVEEREVVAHLSNCNSCQRTLESLSAEPQFWQALGDGLGSGPLGSASNTPHNTDSRTDMEGFDAVRSSAFGQLESLQREQPLTNRSQGQPRHTGVTENTEYESVAHDYSSPDHATALQFVRHWLAPSDDPQYVGRLGVYEIVGVIGVGGMGIVLKGYERALHRCVAIKVLGSHLTASGAARRRFEREAQAAASVVHENVLAIHAIDQWREVPYFVMPLVRGETLERRLQRSGPFSLLEILRIARQIAAGLSAAHQQGVVHRDIKPANILMEHGSERLAITDFGLARAGDDASITRSGFIMGTPLYMSPEQARGDRVDARSDIFSFGSLLYALCTGHPPFRAETPYGVIRRLCDEQPREIQQYAPTIPLWLSGIINKMMHKQIDQRIQSASELQRLFTTALAFAQQPQDLALPVELQTYVAHFPLEMQAARNAKLLAAATLAIVLMAAGLVGSSIWYWFKNGIGSRVAVTAGNAQLGNDDGGGANDVSSHLLATDDSDAVNQNAILNDSSQFQPVESPEANQQATQDNSSLPNNSITKDSDQTAKPTIQTNSRLSSDELSALDLRYNFLADEKLSYSIALELITDNRVMSISGTVGLQVVDVLVEAAELNYDLKLTQEMKSRTPTEEELTAWANSNSTEQGGENRSRNGFGWPGTIDGLYMPGPHFAPVMSPMFGGPFGAAPRQPFSFESQALQNCENSGRAKVSQRLGWLGASHTSELPGQLGPALAWIFPPLGRRAADGMWHAESLVKLNGADPQSPENWSLRKSINCRRSIELIPQSISDSKQVQCEFSIADRSDSIDAPTQTLLGTLYFDFVSGKLEQLDITRLGFADEELVRDSKIRKLRLQIRRVPVESRPNE